VTLSNECPATEDDRSLSQRLSRQLHVGAALASARRALGWVRERAGEGWYLYAIGEEPPRAAADAAQVLRFIDEIDRLLRAEHDEDFCGIVYADDLAAPALIKIYDPNNLGVVCGYSDNPPLPGWVMSKLPPVDLPATQLVAKGRRRWWQRLFG
jgi:hypothetical protein